MTSVYMLLLAFLLIITPVLSVKAASTIKLYYDKKTINYSDKQISYMIDGKQVSKKSYPGIIIGSTSLVSYKDVFINKSTGIEATYSSSKGTLTLKKDYTTIKFKLGSKTVYLDGKKETVSQAPRKVTYKSKGVTKILVPARYVAEAFGYRYNYNSSKANVTITSPKVKALNLYDYNTSSWFTYRGIQGNVTVDGKKINVSSMPSILHESTTMGQAKKIFATGLGADYTYNKDEQTVTLVKDDITIVMTLDDKSAMVNDKEVTLPHAPMKIKNKKNGVTYIMAPISAIASYLNYNFTWDSNTNTSILTKKIVVEPEVGGTSEEYINCNTSEAYKNAFNEANSATTNTELNTSITSTAILGNVEKDTQFYADKEVFNLTSYSVFSKIRSYYSSDNSLVIEVENSTAVNNTYMYTNSIVDSATVTYNDSTQTSKIVFTTKVKQPKYTIQLSEDNLALKVVFYYNYISGLKVKNEATLDLATLETMYPATMEVSEDSTNIYIDLPYTINSIGDQNHTFDNGYCVKGLSAVTNNGTGTRITIMKDEKGSYYSSQSGNVVSLSFLYSNADMESLKITLPQGVSYSTVTDEDMYWNNQFKIIIPGDYINFYNQNPVQVYSSMISNIQVTLNSSGNTEILVTTLSLQGYKLIDKSTYIGVNIGNPQDIYDKIVVLDPGHGGSAPGTIKKGVKEKDVVFKILYTNIKDYFNSKSSSVKAYWTRTSDTDVDLYDRAAFAEEVGADLFISLHLNSATASAKGTETFYSTANNSTQSSGLNSAKLASIFQQGIVDEFGFNNRKVKTANFVVVKYNTVPAILIELGFLSNSSDFEQLTDSENQKDYARKLYELTESVFAQYPTGR